MLIELQFITNNKIKINLNKKIRLVLQRIHFKTLKNFFLMYIHYKNDLNNNTIKKINKKIVKWYQKALLNQQKIS